MTRKEMILRRLVICLWIPGFLIAVLLSFFAAPVVWVFTGKWLPVWLLENADPFQMAEDWRLTKR